MPDDDHDDMHQLHGRIAVSLSDENTAASICDIVHAQKAKTCTTVWDSTQNGSICICRAAVAIYIPRRRFADPIVNLIQLDPPSDRGKGDGCWPSTTMVPCSSPCTPDESSSCRFQMCLE